MADAQAPQTGFAELNGTQFFYEVAGSGPPLALVHAGIADQRMWDDQFYAFAEHFQVLRYDMRGFGQTPMVAGRFSHYQDLHDLLVFLSIERAHLVGCSKGGGVIMDLALEHPAMVNLLVLVCSAPGGYELGGDPPRQWDEMVAAFEARDFLRTSELEVQIWVDGPFRGPDQVPASIRDRVREMNVIALETEASELGSEQPLEPPAATRLGEIRVPTLVVVGDLDNPNMVQACELIAATVPGARKVVIEGTAHLPNMERPEEFNRHVLAFLRQQ